MDRLWTSQNLLIVFLSENLKHLDFFYQNLKTQDFEIMISVIFHLPKLQFVQELDKKMDYREDLEYKLFFQKDSLPAKILPHHIFQRLVEFYS